MKTHNGRYSDVDGIRESIFAALENPTVDPFVLHATFQRRPNPGTSGIVRINLWAGAVLFVIWLMVCALFVMYAVSATSQKRLVEAQAGKVAQENQQLKVKIDQIQEVERRRIALRQRQKDRVIAATKHQEKLEAAIQLMNMGEDLREFRDDPEQLATEFLNLMNAFLEREIGFAGVTDGPG